MGVSIFELSAQNRTHYDGKAVFVCNTTDTAFGPVMDSVKEARQFNKWLMVDPRSHDRLNEAYYEWKAKVKGENND